MESLKRREGEPTLSGNNGRGVERVARRGGHGFLMELFRRQAVERRGHARDLAEGVLAVSDLEGNGIDLDSPLRLRGFLLDRKTDGDVERVSATHLGDFAEVREDQLDRFRDAFCGDHAQFSEEVAPPGEDLSCDCGEGDAMRRATDDVGDLFS